MAFGRHLCPGGVLHPGHPGCHPAKAVKSTIETIEQAKTFEKASEEDKAAVAMALYLYFQEKNNRENRVLTIVPYPSAWGAQLNPRL